MGKILSIFSMLLFFNFTSMAGPTVALCSMHSDCAEGLICNARGACTAECKVDRDCNADSRCLTGTNPNKVCVSFKSATTSAQIPTATSPEAFVGDKDYSGGDYKSFAVKAMDPGLCYVACKTDSNCKAWTYLRAELAPNASAPICYLKNGETSLRFYPGATTGLISR